MTQLAGKRVIVTGAANGQGRAVTRRFLEAGATVLAVDVDEAGLADLGSLPGCVTARCDVAVESDVAAAVRRAVEELGGIDVLYNNAGINLGGQGDGPTHEVTLAVLERVLSVNTVGMFLFARDALRVMLAQGTGGVIVNVASMGGLLASRTHAYSAAKGAVISWTRSLADTYGAHGIRANAIAPGVVETGMARSVIDAPAADEYLAAIPLGRWSQPEELAEVALFLASDASSYMTGSVLAVDGGIAVRP